MDWYFEKETKWSEEIALMREIALSCGLTEELKWGCPTYTLNKRNVVLIHTFREYCAYLLFKGALMNDPENILIRQTENVQSARQVRFTSKEQVSALRDKLCHYIFEAVELEKSGAKVALKKTADYPVPEAFQGRLDELPALQKAFSALTPGRQRAYLFHFGQPKQEKTREERIAKCIPSIMEGKGLLD